jgi:negative regulator of sigma E activity
MNEASRPTSSAPRYGLFVLSALLLTLACGVWVSRARKAAVRATQASERQETQRAVSLLIRAFLADNQLTYSAHSTTSAMFAGQKMQSEAKLTRTPHAMAISYLKGDRQGFQTGYNGRWFWRQDKPNAPLQAYAEVPQEPPATVAKRLSLLLENYNIDWHGSQKVGDRSVEVLEIRPANSIDGAQGPGKRLGIDRETGLTVLTETFDHQWHPVMKSVLSQVDFSPTIEAHTFASPQSMSQAAQRKPWRAQEMTTGKGEVAKATGMQPPAPTYLPQGFVFEGVGVHRCSEDVKGPLAAMARYTDGMNTLSVFAMPEPKADNLQPEQVCDFGPGTLISRKTDTGFVIAVADLPTVTLRRVANSTQIALAR